MQRRAMRHNVQRRVCTVLLAALVLLQPFGSKASAVVVSTGPTTTLSNTAAGATGVTYVFGTYEVEANETLTTIEFTFPDGTDLAHATLGQPAGTMTVSGTSVVIDVSPRLGPESRVTVVIHGVTNTTVTGTYPKKSNPSESMTFWYERTGGGPKKSSLPIGKYEITPAPMISITVSRAAIDFGALLPDETPPAVPLQVTIDSNVPCHAARTLSGDVTDLGLTVEGDVPGTKQAGKSTYVDSVRVSPTWYSRADTALAATILYTVTTAP